MKPIHHALVSARLFGGVPEEYLPVHNAFDMSKAALADMRHRASLHSVDHGQAVMEMIFPKDIGQTTLQNVCIQHVNDDQGFDVTLDHWLSECTVPGYAIATRQAPQSIAAFREDPVQACIQRWGGVPQDYEKICAYYALPGRFSDHPMADAVSMNAFGIFFSEMAFGQSITVVGKSGKPRYVPVRDIGECISMARFGCILNLSDVFDTMSRKDWMMGARVARSRKRRTAAAGRSDLFSETMEGLDGVDAAYVGEAAVKSILSD
jgi:hypothetical protein